MSNSTGWTRRFKDGYKRTRDEDTTKKKANALESVEKRRRAEDVLEDRRIAELHGDYDYE